MATVATTRPRRRATAGPDRITVMLLTLAAFLVILAGLAWQMRSAPAPATHPVVVLRRVYETRMIETVVGAPGAGSSVTQSVSSSGSASALPSAPTTRSS